MLNIEFAHPRLLYLLLLIIPAIVWYIYRHNRVQAELQIPAVAPVYRIRKSFRVYLRHVPFILRMLVLMPC